MIAVVMLPGGGRQRAAPSTCAAAGESRRDPVVSPFALAGAAGACAARQAASQATPVAPGQAAVGIR